MKYLKEYLIQRLVEQFDGFKVNKRSLKLTKSSEEGDLVIQLISELKEDYLQIFINYSILFKEVEEIRKEFFIGNNKEWKSWDTFTVKPSYIEGCEENSFNLTSKLDVDEFVMKLKEFLYDKGMLEFLELHSKKKNLKKFFISNVSYFKGYNPIDYVTTLLILTAMIQPEEFDSIKNYCEEYLKNSNMRTIKLFYPEMFNNLEIFVRTEYVNS